MRYLHVIFAFFLTTAAQVFSQNGSSTENPMETPVWRQALGGTVMSIPSVQARTAVVALDGGNIRAFSETGTPLWNYSAGGRISPHISRSREGTSYLSRTNGVFIAVNRVGRELWRRNLGSPLAARVVTGWDGRLFVPVEKKIFCFTAAGTLLWTITLEENFAVSPKLDHSGGIIFALENNEVYHVNPFGSTRYWTLSNRPAVLLSMENQEILIIYADGTMTLLEAHNELFVSVAYDSESSSLPRFPSAVKAAVNRGNNVAAVLDDGTLSFFSLDELSILWRGDTHINEMTRRGIRPETAASMHDAELLFDDRGIFFLSQNGATGFAHNGTRLWYMILQNTAAIPALGGDGILYSGGRDWILYAYKVEGSIISENNNIYGPAPEGIYWTESSRSLSIPYFPVSEFDYKPMLERIVYEINNGRVGSNELMWKSLLTRIASNRRARLEYRLDALSLLGRIGSQETIPWLSNFMYSENDAALRTAAANAIGNIGVDPEGAALRTFQFIILSGGGGRNEQVLAAIASATGALCRFSGPPLSEAGIRILNLLSQTNQPPIVIRQARSELASLVQY